MTTKEQERKALEQIRKIVAGLGADSYIGIAFEGVLEDAAENIENDFANSQKGRADRAEKKAQDWQMKYEAEKKANKPLQDQVNGLVEQGKFFEKELADRTAKTFELCQARAEQETKISRLEDEIIHLKAKLYDMMVAQQ